MEGTQVNKIPPKWAFTILNKETGLKLASDKVIPPVKACQMQFFMFLIGWGSHRNNYGGGNYGTFWPPTGGTCQGSDTTHPPKFFAQIRIFVAVHVHTIHGLSLLGGTSEYKMPPKGPFFIPSGGHTNPKCPIWHIDFYIWVNILSFEVVDILGKNWS